MHVAQLFTKKERYKRGGEKDVLQIPSGFIFPARKKNKKDAGIYQIFKHACLQRFIPQARQQSLDPKEV